MPKVRTPLVVLAAALAALTALLLSGCTPYADVQQAARKSQREQVAILTDDLGTPDEVRDEMRSDSVLVGVMANLLMTPGLIPEAQPSDYDALQMTDEALLGEQRRLSAVAASRSDDEYVDAIAKLCTSDGMNDAQITASLFTAVAVSAPPTSVSTDATKLRNFQQKQQTVKAVAQLMDEVRSGCREGNVAVAEAAIQAQAQSAKAQRERDIIYMLIAARLSAPRTTVNVSQP